MQININIFLKNEQPSKHKNINKSNNSDNINL